MRYSHEHKFILINNWKCGCSSICEMFDQYCNPCGACRSWAAAAPEQRDKFLTEEFGLKYSQVVHARASDVKEMFEKKEWDFDNYIKITSVRNPWARMVSLYSYQIKMGKIEGKGRSINSGGCFKYYPDNPERETEIADFSEFARKSIPRWQGGRVNRWNTYEMIHDNDGKPLIDYVVKLENLEEELTAITKKHFPDFKLDHNVRVNTSSHDHYSTYYDDESKSIVAEMFAYEIEKWQYKFEKS